MSSPVTVVIIAAGAVFVGVGLGWGGRHVAWPRFARRAAARRFAREFAMLVQGTDVELTTLRGPGSSRRVAGVGAAARAAAAAESAFGEPTHDAGLLTPKALSSADQDYYAASWRNVEGEFTRSPSSALLLATHLTANLLLNRGLQPADTARPSVLPESWTFSSARGYREALRISTQIDAGQDDVSEAEMSRALGLFEDFYWEMLTLSTVTE